MSLLYVVNQKGNPQKPEAEWKYYLQSKIRGHKSYKTILKEAAKNTTVNAKEIDMAVSACMEAVMASLAEGFSVEVEGLGTFYTSIKSEGVEYDYEVSPAKVKAISLAFRPKPEVSKQVSEFKLEKYVPGKTL